MFQPGSLGGGSGWEQCGVVGAGRVLVVCPQPPGMGEDVRIHCVWVYGIISFKDFHDSVVQEAFKACHSWDSANSAELSRSSHPHQGGKSLMDAPDPAGVQKSWHWGLLGMSHWHC